MANPLKVLTQLTASKAAQFQEAVEMQQGNNISGGNLVVADGNISGSAELQIAGAAKLGSSLDVKGASALSGTLGVVGAADLQSTLDVAGAADLASTLTVAGNADLNGELDVQEAANFQDNVDVAGYMKVQGEMSGSAALNIGGQAHIAGAAQLDSTLSVDGNADFDGTLAVVGNISTQASASVAGDLDVNGAADVAGNLDVHGNAVIYGNLEVKGSTTTIESTTLSVADKEIEIAVVASPTDTTADGAGIRILGAIDKTFTWNNDGRGFTSSEDMNLAANKAYKLNGIEALADSGAATRLSRNNGTANVSVTSDTVSIAGDLDLADDLHVSGTLSVDGESTFGDLVTMNGGLHTVGGVQFDAGLNVSGAITAGGEVKINESLGGISELKLSNSFSGIKLDAGAGILTGFNGNIILDWVNSGHILVDTSLSASGDLNVAGASHFVGAVDMDSTLNVDGVASFASDITASAGLDVAGAAHIAGAVDMDSTLNVDGHAIIGDGLEVYGSSTFGGAVFGNDLTASSGLDVVGAAHFAAGVDMDSMLNVDGQAYFQQNANFRSNAYVDFDLYISGTEFVNINTPIVDDRYNVNDAIRALDAKAGQQASNINSNYAALRYLAAANFDANGMAAFTSSFAAADIEQVSVDVLVQAGGSGPWTNDLLSVQVKAAGSYVGFEISAPAMGASDKVRIIAVKESGSLA